MSLFFGQDGVWFHAWVGTMFKTLYSAWGKGMVFSHGYGSWSWRETHYHYDSMYTAFLPAIVLQPIPLFQRHIDMGVIRTRAPNLPLQASIWATLGGEISQPLTVQSSAVWRMKAPISVYRKLLSYNH